VHDDYPEGTLHSIATPGIRWMWQDARTGMALDQTTYDIILSAPLYLRQAGSSLLLSREYLRLAKSRLAPDGVLAVYSDEGSPAQTRLIQRTLAELFSHRVTWFDGLITVASDRPITLDLQAMAQRLTLPDRLYREAAGLDSSMRATGGLFQLFDAERNVENQADRVVTDDHPLIEYPALADLWVGFRGR
jgi:spermidine synthase